MPFCPVFSYPARRSRPSRSEFKAWRASSEVYLPRSRVDVAWYMANALPVLQRTGRLVLRFFYWQMPDDLPRDLQVGGLGRRMADDQ